MSDPNKSLTSAVQSSIESIQQDQFYGDGKQYCQKIPATIDGMLGGFGRTSETEMSDANESLISVVQSRFENIQQDKFYGDGKQYWQKIPATIDGMLGGFGHISDVDIKGSRLFLKQIFNLKEPPEKLYALDCGAGIGRISKHLLTKFFVNVDLVEQNESFLEEAKEYLGIKLQNKVCNYYAVPLQTFTPEKEKYDVIWIQWVLGHLKDDDLVTFLKTCTTGLKSNGVIVIKENITSSDEPEIDYNDSSYTRPYRNFIEVFDKAGLNCLMKIKQHNFPKGLYSVYMFALRPQMTSQL